MVEAGVGLIALSQVLNSLRKGLVTLFINLKLPQVVLSVISMSRDILVTQEINVYPDQAGVAPYKMRKHATNPSSTDSENLMK